METGYVHDLNKLKLISLLNTRYLAYDFTKH